MSIVQRAALVAVFITSLSMAQQTWHKSPNIVMIVADDMGWNDVGHHGGDIPTPNIDALGYHGVILSNHYSQSLCSPSRAALLTGKYPIRLGFQGKPIQAGSTVGLPLSEKILPQYLRKLGYTNHIVGKWHLGSCEKAMLPTSRGFDTHFGFWNGYIGHYDGVHAHHSSGMRGLDLHRGSEGAWTESYGKHITNLLSEEAVAVIRNRTEEEGLFLLVTHAAPHTGNPGLALMSPPNGLGDRGAHIRDHKRRMYADMVKALDDSVGDIVEALADKDLLKNSIIIFISDNGAPSVDPLWSFDNGGSNWPLRGVKASAHEGGVKTTGVVWSPLLKNPGRIYRNLFHITDWLPTFYAAAGGNPKYLAGLDGKNHWETLRTGRGDPPRVNLLVEMDDAGVEAFIMHHWKLVKGHPVGGDLSFSDGFYGESGRDLVEYNTSEVATSAVGRATSRLVTPRSQVHYLGLRRRVTLGEECRAAPATSCQVDHCLFDLAADPCERVNLAHNMTEVVAEMRHRLSALRLEKAAKPARNVDPNSDPRLWNNYWTTWLDPPNEPAAAGLFGPDLLFSCLSLLIAFIFSVYKF